MESKLQNTADPPYPVSEQTSYYPTPGLQQQYPPTGGPASYGQPPPGYPPQPGYVAASPPYQPQVVVVSAGQPQVAVQHVQSYVGHIIFACVVFWCCNWLFGLIAFVLAGNNSPVSKLPSYRTIFTLQMELSTVADC